MQYIQPHRLWIVYDRGARRFDGFEAASQYARNAWRDGREVYAISPIGRKWQPDSRGWLQAQL